MLNQCRLLTVAILPFLSVTLSAKHQAPVTAPGDQPTQASDARPSLFLAPPRQADESRRLRLAGGTAFAAMRLLAAPAGQGQGHAVVVAAGILDEHGSYEIELPAGLAGLDFWALVQADNLHFGPLVTAVLAVPATDTGDPNLVPMAGSILVTEIMKNPAAVTDTLGEWVEFYNTRNVPIDIEGWVLSDLGSDATVLDNGGAGIVIPPRGYGVVARDSDPNVNGGLIVLASYSGFSLTNSDDEVRLSLPSGALIDEVAYDDGILWPDPTGASLQLSNRRLGVLMNDEGSHWCAASAAYGAGDLGTPGARNDDC